MKNFHNENKFVLVRSLGPVKLSVDECDYSYLCDIHGNPLFICRAKVYLALEFTIKFPFVYVVDFIELPERILLTKKFIS